MIKVLGARPPPQAPPQPGTGTDEKDRRIAALERELRIKSETLQTTIEELETSNEELSSTNEELQSTNEELQSTNEEMETSKEELQSVNEELVTVNNELQQKMDSLSRANNDMSNLLTGTGIGMLFVDYQLHIQPFTPAITQIINLIQTDLGRPVSDLVSNLVSYDRLGEDVKAVLDTLVSREAEVQTRSGRWYLMRILPYRTSENVIEGAVLTFVDINAQKRAEEQLRTLSTDLERRVQERVSELKSASRQLRDQTRQREEGEARRVADIASLTRLFDLAAPMAPEQLLQKLFERALSWASPLMRLSPGSLLWPESIRKTAPASCTQCAKARNRAAQAGSTRRSERSSQTARSAGYASSRAYSLNPALRASCSGASVFWPISPGRRKPRNCSSHEPSSWKLPCRSVPRVSTKPSGSWNISPIRWPTTCAPPCAPSAGIARLCWRKPRG